MTESPPRTSSPDLSGRQLGDYQLLRRLGRGGMAEVYLAEQQSLQRQVAIKVLRADLARDSSYVKRFMNEAQSAAKLVHANIVQIHEVGCIDGIHFIAQEYVRGQNLKQYLARYGAAETPLAVTIMRQVAAALHKAAQHGIVHRDIKPENIMIDADGIVKVADFGLARATGDAKSLELTEVGVTMGTPLYMSPEQVEGRTLDVRSDIYSFGVTCYQLLAGRPPFEGENPLSVAVQHLKNEPERLENRRVDLPASLSRIVHKMLAKSPEKRYDSPAALLKDLRALEVEGSVEGDWNHDSSMWLPDSAGVATRFEATERLETLMQTAAMRAQNRRLPGGLMMIVAVLSLGGLLAWTVVPRDPLANATEDDPSTISPENLGSPGKQLMFAKVMNTEAAYKSVWQYYDKNENDENLWYWMLSKKMIAWFYLNDGKDLEKALATFIELTESEDAGPDLQAYGYAGQTVVYLQQHEYDLAAIAYSRYLLLQGDREILTDTLMLRRLEEAYNKYQEDKNRSSSPLDS
ncbi:MAG: serine/threonine-protein kinase [Pirellulaceae bacterium]